MPSRPPTGTVTFLFTDVVGSTRSWEADPVGMARSIELHDSIIRDGVEQGDGYVFSTAGDGFGIAFSEPHRAISAAVGIQRALQEAEWPGPQLEVRMGLHTGTAEERTGDYFGPVVNRAARIQAAGHGNQIVTSAGTAEMAAGRLDESTSLLDLGIHVLRDVDEPLRLFTVQHTALPTVDQPLRVLDSVRHNLPEFLTSFVGRKGQLDQLVQLLEDSRLVVLTGVGGTGKTRLALEAARKLLPDYRDGAWLVELAPVTNPGLVMTAIGDTWGLRPGEGAPIDDVIIRYLRGRELLVIMDNCEHLLHESAAAVRQLLESATGVRLLATSRESLGVPGEALLQVPSLALPSDDHDRDSESVRLFLERAKTVRPDLSLDDTEMEAVARICRRVDGMPLGLELAAARLRSLSVHELAERLDDSFRVLAGSAKASLPRQRTLGATIDWSHDLLDDPDRVVFRRLAVFAGGFDLEAAEAVSSGEGVEGWEVVDRLDSLVDKSLVLPSHQSSRHTRYRMLEPVRQYAQERLVASGEARRVQADHARYFADLVAGAGPRLRGPDQAIWQRRLESDHANLRSAFDILLENGEVERHLQMTFDLFPYWMASGLQLEAVATALAGLALADREPEDLLQVKLWWTTAFLGAQLTRPEAIEHARIGKQKAESLGDPNAEGRMELVLGAAIAHASTDPEYLDHLEEGRRLLEENPEPAWWDADWDRALSNAILAEYLPSEDPRIVEHFEAAVAGFESVGDEAFLAIPLTTCVGMARKMGSEWIAGNLRRAVAITERLDMPLWRGHARYFLGVMTGLNGDHARVVEPIAAGARDLEECGDLNCWAGALRFQAISEAATGAVSDARTHLRMVIQSLPELPMQDLHRVRIVDASISVLVAAGDYEKAAIALGLAEAHEPPVQLAVDRGLDSLREQVVGALGEDRTNELTAEGAAYGLEKGIEVLLAWMET